MDTNQDTSANNKRIAKNTLLLYGRMLLMMIISLYTSRVIINALGIQDYGIYGVVGGVVALFTIISGSLSAAISRFITVELAKGDMENLKKVFCASVSVQVILIIIITLLLETIGVWFLNNKMVIPSDRIAAANWVFQFSVITFALNLICVPYSAAIIAHEKMSAFAYISIIDAVARLAISFVILLNPFDRLVYYGLLILIVGVIQRFIYTVYCKKHFEECHFKFIFDKPIVKEMFGFAGWNFIGASSAVLRDQGGNMIINLFCGPAVNAARGVAMSVHNAVNSFVSNFQVALNPQITKTYASGDYEYMFKLIFQGTRLSYYILLILALPIIFTAPYLLQLWLGLVPEHATRFTQLILIYSLSEALSGPLITVMLATGKIRNYQLIVGGCQLLNLPAYYLFLKQGFPVESVFIVMIAISIISEFARLFMLRNMIQLSIRAFLKDVYFNVIYVSLLSALIPFLLKQFFGVESIQAFIIIVVLTVLCTVAIIYFVGCNKHERKLVKAVISKVLNKIR